MKLALGSFDEIDLCLWLSRIEVGMYYLFIDESYLTDPGRRTIVMGAWAVEQDKWTRNVCQLADLYRPPVLKSIQVMLESLNASAVLTRASLDPALSRAGEVDGTDGRLPSIKMRTGLSPRVHSGGFQRVNAGIEPHRLKALTSSTKARLFRLITNR
jgi:hypothetical protein